MSFMRFLCEPLRPDVSTYLPRGILHVVHLQTDISLPKISTEMKEN